MNVNLSPDELAILVSSLNSLSKREEYKLNEQYGNIAPLYNKLYSLMMQETATKVSHAPYHWGN
jgi:hypothetical protein